ncbi:hypothetical protein Vretimale_12444 [Volvox reticuliferus]|uniref:Uncharacterized protein n=1 Tax=Volvox reticuliferus TaxID=1737510 RepID=A0A8J4LSS4_9CHLO|nr:hypothetical protein Vretifemale_9021 [Volvox reticuliferus]GIM08467.1 hypothetical protein Vretimale_12444 [Volvox reticuliferus]
MDAASGACRRLHAFTSGSKTSSALTAPPMPRTAFIARLLWSAQAGHTRSSPSNLRAVSSGPRKPSPERLDAWTLTLERGVGTAYGTEAELQATGAFRAEVFPDLPVATTWQNLAKVLSSGPSALPAANREPPFTHYTTRRGALKVITIAANLRSEYDIERRLVAAAGDGVEAAGGQRANVLLCVSGSHPVRTLPLVSRFLCSSLDTLRLAQRLRQRGYIPSATQLWVVANPNTERSAALLEAKAAQGASAVLTQPPLDWPAYLSWLSDAERRDLLCPAPPPPAASHFSKLSSPLSSTSDRTLVTQPGFEGSTTGSNSRNDSDDGVEVDGARGLRLLVGHPMLSSAANLSFWMALSGCSGAPAAQALLAEATRAELKGQGAVAQYFEHYNRRLAQQVLARGGLGGLHVMAITKASKRMVLGMLGDGTLPPSAS